MPKYYKCNRTPKPHFLHCPDGKVIRGNFTCPFPFGGGFKTCGKPLSPIGSALPAFTDQKRVMALPDRMITDDPTTPRAVEAMPIGSPPSMFSHTNPATTAPTSGGESYFHCKHPVNAHKWQYSGRIPNPEGVKCPAKDFFGPCGQSLSSVPRPFGEMLALYKPLPMEAVASGMPKVEHTFLSVPIPSTSEPRLRRYEQRSQDELTGIFLKADGIELFCRDGQFRASPTRPTEEMKAEEWVDEPGLTSGGCLRFMVSSNRSVAIGRLEISRLKEKLGVMPFQSCCSQNPLVRGVMTYPDFLLKQGENIFAVELKTPNAGSLGPYLERDFFGEKKGRGLFAVERTVEEEIECRAARMPAQYLQVLAFDLCNLTESIKESISALQASICGGHQEFWRMIVGFLFIDKEGRVKTYSKSTILEYGTAQTTITSFATGVPASLRVEEKEKSMDAAMAISPPTDPAFTMPPPPNQTLSQNRPVLGPVCEKCGTRVADPIIPFCARCKPY